MSSKIYEFLADVLDRTTITYPQIYELFNGAFIIIKGDNGYFYEKYMPNHYMLSIKEKRETSHYSHSPKQVRMGGGTLFHLMKNMKTKEFDLLIGTSIRPRCEGDTWFQFETSNLKSFSGMIRHFVSYIAYKITNKNQGPFGSSIYTEERPLYICVKNNGKCITSNPNIDKQEYEISKKRYYRKRESK